MPISPDPKDKNSGHFLSIASELHQQFPDLDLRFNMKSGGDLMRFKVASVSSDTHELRFEEREGEELLHEAIFMVKEIAKLYDA